MSLLSHRPHCLLIYLASLLVMEVWAGLKAQFVISTTRGLSIQIMTKGLVWGEYVVVIARFAIENLSYSLGKVKRSEQ